MSNELNLDDLLANQSVTEVEDLPELVTLPAGVWKVKGISAKSGETQKRKPKVGVTMEVLELVELKESEKEEFDPETISEKFPEGSMAYYMFADAEGPKVLSRLKKAFGATMEANNMATFGELFDQFDQLEFFITVGRRQDADDPERFYGELQAVEIA